LKLYKKIAERLPKKVCNLSKILSKDFEVVAPFLQTKQNCTFKMHFYLFLSWTVLKFNFEGSTSRNHFIKIYEKFHRIAPFLSCMVFYLRQIRTLLSPFCGNTAQLKIFKLITYKRFQKRFCIYVFTI